MEVYKSLLKKYIDDNQYYTYNEIIKILENIIKTKKEVAGDYFYFMSEYGEINHGICKQIYFNLFNKEKVRELGQLIADRGDKISLLACYYIILNCSPLMNAGDDYQLFNTLTARLLNEAFRGITDKSGNVWK